MWFRLSRIGGCESVRRVVEVRKVSFDVRHDHPSGALVRVFYQHCNLFNYGLDAVRDQKALYLMRTIWRAHCQGFLDRWRRSGLII